MIGDEEANVVAYCTMKGFGTRLIADGTITGLQVRNFYHSPLSFSDLVIPTRSS